MPLESKFSADKSSVEIVVPAVAMTAEQIDFLIADIGAIRSQMVPEVPQAWPQGKPTHRHDLTKYVFGFDPFAKTPILSLRSPAFGWLTFAIAAIEIDRIGHLLREAQSRLAGVHSDKSHQTCGTHNERLTVTRNPKQLLRMEDAIVSPDGKSLWVKIITDGQTLDVAIPFDELGDTVQFLVTCAAFVISHSDQADNPTPTGMQKNHWAPIPTRGVGLGLGRTPDESILMVQLACCQLAFPVPGSDLARLADDFSRTARTLSAGHGKPN
jgi:hypothetical protein